MTMTIARVILALPGLLFLIMGLRWLVDPAGAAAELGMPLLEGAALSTQLGDLSAFFITLGSCILLGVVTRRRIWFYPAIALLTVAASGRLIAFFVHDAALPVPLVAVELVIAALLGAGSRLDVFAGGEDTEA